MKLLPYVILFLNPMTKCDVHKTSDVYCPTFCLLWPRPRSSLPQALAASHCVTDCTVDVLRFVSIREELLRSARALRILIKSQVIFPNSFVFSIETDKCRCNVPFINLTRNETKCSAAYFSVTQKNPRGSAEGLCAFLISNPR